MGKIRTIVLFLATFVLGIGSVNAVCDITEENRLRSLAANVRASYEEAFEEVPEGEYTPPDGLTDDTIDDWKMYDLFFNVYIENITEDIYVEVYDAVSKQTKKYTYADSNNGVITIKQDIDVKNQYTISVFPTQGSECSGKLASHVLSTPVFNEYSTNDYCQSNPEYYLCYKYVDYELPNFDEFLNRIDQYMYDKEKKQQQQEEEEKKNNSFGEFIRRNKGAVIVLSIIVIGAGVATTVVIIYRRRRVV